MSAYDNDDRVEKVNGGYLVVHKAEVLHQVWTDRGDEWFTNPSTSTFPANVRTHAEAEAWVESMTKGPFRSADDAIRELIGDPR